MWRRPLPPTVGPVRKFASRREDGMGGMAKRFEEAAESIRFPNGHEQVVDVLGTAVGLATFEPGWRWSNDVRPLTGAESCPRNHAGYVVSGRLHVELNDGTTLDLAGGDAFEIPPGHDAWVVGDEPCVMLDWTGEARTYLQPAAAQGAER